MTKKRQQNELDKSERIKKHDRGNQDRHKIEGEKLDSLRPKHKPAKKNHVNYLDAYEKHGEDYEGYD